MNFKIEFFIYVALFFVLSFALGFGGMRLLLRGEEVRGVVSLLGSVGCLLMPMMLVRIVKGEGDDDDPDA